MSLRNIAQFVGASEDPASFLDNMTLYTLAEINEANTPYRAREWRGDRADFIEVIDALPMIYRDRLGRWLAYRAADLFEMVEASVYQDGGRGLPPLRGIVNEIFAGEDRNNVLRALQPFAAAAYQTPPDYDRIEIATESLRAINYLAMYIWAATSDQVLILFEYVSGAGRPVDGFDDEVKAVVREAYAEAMYRAHENSWPVLKGALQERIIGTLRRECAYQTINSILRGTPDPDERYDYEVALAELTETDDAYLIGMPREVSLTGMPGVAAAVLCSNIYRMMQAMDRFRAKRLRE